MLGIEEILYEVERNEMSEGGLPPGFRFHPTDEELITYYLASKVFNGSFSGLHIAEVDLNRCEPWELPDVAKMGEREWYFFSLRDRKYPTGLRTNRATGAGYWKATGKDREVYAAPSLLIGMKKTLVFYKGRAPRGEKTKWVMHEYRLHGHFSCRHSAKEEWVICRIFHKMGEKKSSTLMVQGQNYLIKHNPTNSLPPLLEPPPTLLDNQSIMQTLNQNQNPNPNPFLIYPQQSDLKTLINPLVSQCDHFQPHPTSFDSDALASNQDLALKELTTAIARQCKKEPDFTTHFQLLSDHGFCQENDHNSFLFGLRGCSSSGGGGGGSSGGVGILSTTVGHNNVDAMDAAAIDHVMSTEPAFRWW